MLSDANGVYFGSKHSMNDRITNETYHYNTLLFISYY